MDLLTGEEASFQTAACREPPAIYTQQEKQRT
jgi:hypothetical protein